MNTTRTATGPTAPGRVLHLLDGLRLTRSGTARALPDGGSRVVAFVALHGRAVDRRHAAGTLWPACSEDRATANLRSTLWRLTRAADPVVVPGARDVRLADDVQVDLHQIENWAAGGPDVPCLNEHRLPELLSGWDDTWVLPHRERVRQRVLYSLEYRSAALRAAGRVDEGLAVANRALTWAPARESAVRSVVECLVARGDRSGADAVYGRYCTGLRTALALAPGRRLSGVLG